MSLNLGQTISGALQLGLAYVERQEARDDNRALQAQQFALARAQSADRMRTQKLLAGAAALVGVVYIARTAKG